MMIVLCRVPAAGLDIDATISSQQVCFRSRTDSQGVTASDAASIACLRNIVSDTDRRNDVLLTQGQEHDDVTAD